jgi:NAD(P)-dependent dehydrogenase (short-subunit alcohol dehydrogenase family)
VPHFLKEEELQHPAGRVRIPNGIAQMVLFLCSGFITGKNITIDGGMSKLMIYYHDHGWSSDSEKN